MAIRLLLHPDGKYYARCGYDERDILRGAGFKWEAARKCWYTADTAVAVKLVDYAINEQTKMVLRNFQKTYDGSFEHENVSGFTVESPESMTYRSYQLLGIKWASERRVSLIADEMGLGKTIQGIGVAVHTGARSILVVCPASVKENWAKEFSMWHPDNPPCRVIYGTKSTQPFTVHKENVIIINYDLLTNPTMRDAINARKWDLIIMDEVHTLKNMKSKRTKNILGTDGIARCDARIVGLSGTPIPNRPVEFYPFLSALAKEAIAPYTSFEAYARRYCGAYMNAWMQLEAKGATNVEELNQKLRSTIMIRRLKKDVAKELPDKTLQVITIEPDAKTSSLLKKEFDFVDMADFRSSGVKLLSGTKGAAFDELAAMRQEMMEFKLPHCIKHIEDLFESGITKLGVFAYHRATVKAIEEHFKDKNPLVITGETDTKKRQGIVEAFQTNPEHQLFIGNIKAAGVGITLTAASHCVFVEVTWVPGEILQAIDRFHRIGQKNSVLAQFLVLKNSVDEHMIRSVADKQRVLNQVLDTKHVMEEEWSFA